MNSKVCNNCGIEKPLSEYYRETKGKDGRRGKCKVCDNSRIKTYNQNPLVKERQKVYNTLWKANNKDKIRGYNKKHGPTAQLKYRQTEHGREARKKALSKYFKTDKGKTADKRKHHKRRVIMENAGTFTNEQWQERLAEYNYCCAYCYQQFPVEDLTIDHMIPLSRGGTNTIDNLVPACKSCNSRKKDKTPLEMLQKGLM
jgi:5-methylcytosine-specific restriction endonuclease McrA